ncbi:MAG: hypothetical protein AAGG69_06420 [Pseudomonadota bacterium]
MYDQSSKPTWNVTFWALACFALAVGLVLLVGADNAEVASTVVQPVS